MYAEPRHEAQHVDAIGALAVCRSITSCGRAPGPLGHRVEIRTVLAAVAHAESRRPVAVSRGVRVLERLRLFANHALERGEIGQQRIEVDADRAVRRDDVAHDAAEATLQALRRAG